MTATAKPRYQVGQRVEVFVYNFDVPGFPQQWIGGEVESAEPIGDPKLGRWDIKVRTDKGTYSPQVVGPRGGNKHIRPAA